MKTRQLLYAASLLLLLSACSNDDTQEQTQGVPIRLSYTTLQAVETRAAAATGLNDANIESGREVMVKIANVNTTEWIPYTYTTGESGAMTAPTSPQIPLYPTDDTHIQILAYHPAAAGTNTGTTFTVQADQSTDEGYQASDLMFSNNVTNQEKQVTPVELAFVHKMAKIVVNVTAGTGVSSIVSATLKQVKPSVTFNQTTGVVSTNTDADAINVAVIKEGTQSTATGAALIPAQTINGALLEITTDLGTATYTVSDKVFESGHKYTLNISVSRTTVNTTTAIGTWEGDGSVTINSQGSPFMTFTVGGVSFKMVYVEGTNADISMNWDDQTSGASYNRHPITVKGISDYYIGQTEVNNALWYAVMDSKPPVRTATNQNNGQPNAGDQYPVAYVSWDQICNAETGFLDKLNALVADQLPTGMKFILPSEVQWQFAAIGGLYSNGYTYAGSSTWGDSAWEGDNSGSTTHPVATKPANELGLYDMSGNVWEWCSDLYATVTDNQELPKDYIGASGSSRVIRGGCWSNTSANAACFYPSFRFPYAATIQHSYVGFRLALQ